MDQEKWRIYCYDSEIKHEISTFEIQKQKCPCNILIPIHFPVDIRGQHKWNIHLPSANPGGIQEWNKSLNLHHTRKCREL